MAFGIFVHKFKSFVIVLFFFKPGNYVMLFLQMLRAAYFFIYLSIIIIRDSFAIRLAKKKFTSYVIFKLGEKKTYSHLMSFMGNSTQCQKAAE